MRFAFKSLIDSSVPAENRVRENVRVNSPHQFEFKQRITFPKTAERVKYTVETYLFLPPALQVTADNYTSASLLRTLKNYIRLRAQKIPLDQFLQDGGPFSQLDAALDALPPNDPTQLDDYENTLKRFSLTFRQSVKNALEEITLQSETIAVSKIAATTGMIETILDSYRTRKTRMQSFEIGIQSHAWAYCDEFMSIIIAYYLRDAFLYLSSERRAPITALWEKEKQYRANYYPESVPDSGRDNESILFRWSILKKYVSSFLFLDVRTLGGQPLLLHSLYGLAAAVSMLFATGIAFSWQDTYGSLSINLFWAMVIGYIFKDRIKESSRAWLFKRFQKWIPDRRLHLFRNNVMEAGSVHESFRFTAREQLPAQIRALRDRAHTISMLSSRLPESILLYKKVVTLEEIPLLVAQTSNSVLDITRFNLNDFLHYADNLFEELPVIEEDDSDPYRQPTVGEKIYHIYVARRIVYGSHIGSDLIRLVINSKGIKRLEMVSPLKFTEGRE